MIGELVYTSAPAGLRPGTSGFCTVGATKGLSKRDQLALESLSGYEFAFGLSDPRAGKNPPSFIHTTVTSAGSTRRVLSRIGFAGADHTGRSNKIAHHLLLDPGEELTDGPAIVAQKLDCDGGWFLRWEGPPRELDPRKLGGLVSKGSAPVRSAERWARQTGDAGWAGALARAFREQPTRPAFLIFDAGTDVLGLFAESLAILPEDERWRVCFSTYFSGSLPPDTPCHWRAILAGSPAVALCARFPGAMTLDLTRQLAAPNDDSFTVAARQGTTVGAPVSLTTPTGPGAIRSKAKRKSRANDPAEFVLELVATDAGKTSWWSSRSIAAGARGDQPEPTAVLSSPWPYLLAALFVAALIVAVPLMSHRTVNTTPPAVPSNASAPSAHLPVPLPERRDAPPKTKTPTTIESSTTDASEADTGSDSTPVVDSVESTTTEAPIACPIPVELRLLERPAVGIPPTNVIAARTGQAEGSCEWSLESLCDRWQVLEPPLGRYVRAVQSPGSVKLEVYTTSSYKPLAKLSMERRGHELLLVLEPNATGEHQPIIDSMAFELVSADNSSETFTCVVRERPGSRMVRIGLVDEDKISWPEPLRYQYPRDVIPGNVAGAAPVSWPPATIRMTGFPPTAVVEPGVELGSWKAKVQANVPDDGPLRTVQLMLRHERSSTLESVSGWWPGRKGGSDLGIAHFATEVVTEHRKLVDDVNAAHAVLASAEQNKDPQKKLEARRSAERELEECKRRLQAHERRYSALQEWLSSFATCGQESNGLELFLLDPWGLPLGSVVMRWESRNLEQLLPPATGHDRSEGAR